MGRRLKPAATKTKSRLQYNVAEGDVARCSAYRQYESWYALFKCKTVFDVNSSHFAPLLPEDETFVGPSLQKIEDGSGSNAREYSTRKIIACPKKTTIEQNRVYDSNSTLPW
jgi:hypothetical protein